LNSGGIPQFVPGPFFLRLGEANTLQALGNLSGVEGNLGNAVDQLLQALRIHLKINDYLSIAADLVFLVRTKNDEKQFHAAVILSQTALGIYRTIIDRWGQALCLKDQGTALERLKEENAAIAAKWQAREIFQEIQPQAGEDLDHFFADLEKERGEKEFRRLCSHLTQHAEQERNQAVNHIHHTHGSDAFVREIMKLLKSKHEKE
jgi:tetratricopeptide (TPR) repeat protein